MRRLLILFILLALLVPAVGSQAQGTITHTVVRGDNLFRISLRYNTSIAAIVAANPSITNPNLIFVGQVLVIPTGGTTPPPPPTQPPPPTTEISYTVQPGDWLSKIAPRFGTTVQAIAQRNGIVNPNLIFAGQVLIIPASGGTQPGGNPPPPPPPPTNTGSFELGGQVFGFQFAQQMKGAGMTWAKRQITWNQGDPASIAQGFITEAHNQGFKILLSIKGQPQQISANPGAYFQQFAAFLGGVAGLGPDAIEVWNEQNIDREWPSGLINPASYTQMLTAAYSAIKNAKSSVIVISGAPAPTGFFGGACNGSGCDDKPYLEGMRNAGAANAMDCVGIHYNEGILGPDARSGDPRGNSSHYTRYYPTMVETYRAIFPTRPLCFTELGYLSPEGLGPLPANFSWASAVTVQDQATWLARAVTLSRSNGAVRLLVVWNVDATEYGADPQAGYAIIRPNNQCLACNTLAAAMQ